MRHHIYLIIFLILTTFFVWTRLYKIESTLEFWNDMGRDLVVLYDWQHTGKPPLLGPQMSNLPFNQSAVYFYMLMPLYLLTNGSLINAVYTCVLFSVCAFGLTYWLVSKYDKTLRLPVLLFILLATLQPQMIIQQRFVWNPSFVLPSLMLAGFSFLMLAKQWNTRLLAACSTALGLAIALNVSSFPVLVAFWVASVVLWKKKSLMFIAATIASTAFWNLPTILFELSHRLLLTRTIFERGMTEQLPDTVLRKTHLLAGYTFGFDPVFLSVGCAVLVFMLIIALAVMHMKKYAVLKPALVLFVSALVVTLISPFGIQAHYIFPMLSVFLLLVTTVPWRYSILATLVLSVMWLQPSQIQSYLQPPRRTVAEIEACAQQVCSVEKDPLFVSMQAGYHNFHNSPEFRYLLKRHDCQVKTLELDTNAAQRMAVVVDNSTYEHGKNSYNELTLFGPSSVSNTYTCGGNIQIIMLQKEL